MFYRLYSIDIFATLWVEQPSFRIAAVLEEIEWGTFRKYLNINNNKKNQDKKIFKEIFSIANLYNSACSNAANPIRIHPIMMSIIFHHYKNLLKSSVTIGFDNNSSSAAADYDINNYNNNSTTILKQEIDKWYNFSFVLRKQNRELFEQMLQSSYKYSSSINANGKDFSTESLLMSLIFDQNKMMLLDSFFNNKIDYYL